MNLSLQISTPRESVTIRNDLLADAPDDIIENLLADLQAPWRQISSIYFYDAQGSRLFEEITALPEYYLTRTEKPLIQQAAKSLASQLMNLEVVELGSGDCSKISLLFQELPPSQLATLCYRPIDISLSAVEASATQLIERFPYLTVDALVTNFITQIGQIQRDSRQRLFCFFGSTLGNLDPLQREQLFDGLGNCMRPGERLLLGVDMVKDRAVLERAYNDAAGITDKFNRNILNVMNRIAGTDFADAQFEHMAFYNEESDRIEMHLRARSEQRITSPHLGEDIIIAEGETIHTENSHKFTRESVLALSRRAGLVVETQFTDPKEWFSLYQFVRHD